MAFRATDHWSLAASQPQLLNSPLTTSSNSRAHLTSTSARIFTSFISCFISSGREVGLLNYLPSTAMSSGLANRCDLCAAAEFSNSDQLRIHKDTYHPTVSCPVCQRAFDRHRPDNLKRHMATHQPSKPPAKRPRVDPTTPAPQPVPFRPWVSPLEVIYTQCHMWVPYE